MTHDAQLRPQSPCIRVCVLDDANLCIGCLRNLTEIASWADMTSAEQWRLLKVLKERRKLRAPQPEAGSEEPPQPR
jgi:predicted Fe-S protein YdhL (DUF1289 family)